MHEQQNEMFDKKQKEKPLKKETEILEKKNTITELKHLIFGAARAGRRPRPGFWFPVKWWDSLTLSDNLEPANQYAPSKKQRES